MIERRPSGPRTWEWGNEPNRLLISNDGNENQSESRCPGLKTFRHKRGRRTDQPCSRSPWRREPGHPEYALRCLHKRVPTHESSARNPLLPWIDCDETNSQRIIVQRKNYNRKMRVMLSRRFRWSRFIRMLEMPFMFYTSERAIGTNGKQLHDGTPKRFLHGNLGFLFRSDLLGCLLRENEFLSASTSHNQTTPYINSSVASTGT